MGQRLQHVVAVAKEMLRLYFNQPHKEIKGSEVPFTVPLVNLSTGEELDIAFEGFMDLIEADDTIIEFKTSVQTMNQDDVDNHLQLTAYAYEMLYRKPPKLLKIVDFVKNKKPKMIELETKRCKDNYVRFFHLAGQVLKGIRNQVFFPRQSFMCTDCEYEGNCRAWAA